MTVRSAEHHPKFPRQADPFTQSAWRIGWEQGHGLRQAPKGIKYGLENTYRLGLRIAAEERPNDSRSDTTKEELLRACAVIGAAIKANT